MQTETLIIGAGLSGLRLASRLAERGRDFLAVEARDRVGGRILTAAHAGGAFDLGPAWFWPGQPRIFDLTAELGLTAFEQYAEGDLVFEDPTGLAQRGRGFASMQGAYRLEHGLGALTDALAQTIPEARLRLSEPVLALAKTEEGATATLGSGERIRAQRIVVALPPRVAAEIAFSPLPPEPVRAAMTAVPTWMAGQAKAIAVYPRPFWREAGFSGDAMSQRGPMVEIHDASQPRNGPYALFGFIGAPPEARQDVETLKRSVIAQLVRLFGAEAAEPEALLIKDWASDPYTATELDREPMRHHPRYGMPRALSAVWDGALLFSGTEVAPEFGGFIEGALEAADITLAALEAARG